MGSAYADCGFFGASWGSGSMNRDFLAKPKFTPIGSNEVIRSMGPSIYTDVITVRDKSTLA